MRVAVVHYHYRPGGVTRVVENAFESLQGRGIAMVAISGEPYAGGNLPVRMQPGLRYSQANEKLSPGPLWYALKATARRALGSEPDLWHFHNHALGKNSAMAEVVDKMAMDAPVLLQCHDFAEDGRPANYAMLRARTANLSRLYPQGAQVHYAVCNARDAAFMRQAGFCEGNVHLLPNPVQVPQGNGGDDFSRSCAEDGAFPFLEQGQALYLYPTRAIRRKNIGEFLLWAALGSSRENAVYALTLAPANPLEQAEYRRWVDFAQEMKLPVAFGVGEGRSAAQFAALMQRAKAVVTTSVAEGFGLAFLEPYLFGRPVLGRNLPDITADFSAQGVDLGALYGRLLVPEALLSVPQLRQKIISGLQHSYEAYGRSVPQGAADRCFESMRDAAGRIDFGRLDEELQRQAITNLIASPRFREQIVPKALDPLAAGAFQSSAVLPQSGISQEGNPLASDDGGLGEAGSLAAIVTRNRAVVQSHYGLAAYGDRLAALYEKVADSRRERLGYLEEGCLLDCFLAPERFALLCS